MLPLDALKAIQRIVNDAIGESDEIFVFCSRCDELELLGAHCREAAPGYITVKPAKKAPE